MTKTLTLTAVLAACYLFSNAQIKKDAVLLGGQVSVNSTKTKVTPTPANPTRENSGMVITLSAGKAVKENTVVGLYGGYGTAKSSDTYSNNSSNSSESSNTTAGVFYRKYKGLSKNFYFFGELNAGYTGYKQQYENKTAGIINTSTNTTTGAELGVTPGISYQVLKKMQIEILMPSFAGIRYSVNKNTGTNTTTQKGNSFQFNSSLNGGFINGLAVGFRLVL